jgi:hypothetical protein
MLSDLDIENIKRIANDAPLFAALRKFFAVTLKDAERLGIDLSFPNEVVGENCKAAFCADKRISDALDVLASHRDTYTQPEDEGHV